jgi:hypothetical protein
LIDPRRPSRRDLLAGAIGGAAGLVGGVGLSAISDSNKEGAPSTGGAPADAPFLLGSAESALPKGILRADLRAFKTDTGSDWHDAFTAALSAADAVYVPAGTWLTGRPIDLATGKALWSDSVWDKEDEPISGAIVRSSTTMPATVRLTGFSASVFGVNIDGADTADAAIEFTSDSVFLGNVSAKRGKSYALKATGNFCTIWGGVYQQPSNIGYAVYVQGSDLIMWGARVKKGITPLWLDGSGAVMGLLHVTGRNDPDHASAAVARVTGSRNQLVNVFYDTAVGPSILLEGGGSFNRFIGMTVRNSGSNGSFPVIRCDARGGGNIRNNRFDGFNTDVGQGTGWTYLLEMLGPPGVLSGNQLGSGYADGCKQLWNLRPSSVGDIVSEGRLSRNSGRAEVSPGASALSIAHGLKGSPNAINVTPSGGSSPDVSVGPDQIALNWGSPPGRISVWWTAEL